MIAVVNARGLGHVLEPEITLLPIESVLLRSADDEDIGSPIPVDGTHGHATAGELRVEEAGHRVILDQLALAGHACLRRVETLEANARGLCREDGGQGEDVRGAGDGVRGRGRLGTRGVDGRERILSMTAQPRADKHRLFGL